MKIANGQSASVNRSRTDNTMTKRKKTKGQTTINKTLLTWVTLFPLEQYIRHKWRIKCNESDYASCQIYILYICVLPITFSLTLLNRSSFVLTWHSYNPAWDLWTFLITRFHLLPFWVWSTLWLLSLVKTKSPIVKACFWSVFFHTTWKKMLKKVEYFLNKTIRFKTQGRKGHLFFFVILPLYCFLVFM